MRAKAFRSLFIKYGSSLFYTYSHLLSLLFFFPRILLSPAPPGCPRGNSWDFNYNEDNIDRLRNWISLTANQSKAAGEEGKEGKGEEKGNGGTEMDALHAFAESVGMSLDDFAEARHPRGGAYHRCSSFTKTGNTYKVVFADKDIMGAYCTSIDVPSDEFRMIQGDIMNGVVTQCVNGPVEGIYWHNKQLDGTFPMGDLKMPWLCVLNLSGNPKLEGERERN